MSNTITDCLNQLPFSKPDTLTNETLAPYMKAAQDCPTALANWFYQQRWLPGIGTADEFEWLSHQLERLGEMDKAIEVGDGASIMLMSQKQPKRALALLDRLLQIFPDFALMHSKALLLMGQGETQTALSILTEAARLAAEAMKSAEKQAPDFYREIADIHQHLAEAQESRGALLKALQNREKALAAYLKAGDSQQACAVTISLINQYQQQGGSEEAQEHFHAVMSDDCIRNDANIQSILWDEYFRLFAPTESPNQFKAALAAMGDAGNLCAMAHAMHNLAKKTLARADLIQAYCLNLLTNAPLIQVANLAGGLLQKESDQQRPEAPLIAASLIAHTERTPRDYPRHAQIHRMSVVQLISCARLQGIPEPAVKKWAADERLYLEDGVIERCIQTLSEMNEAEPWWFDKRILTNRSSA